MGLSRDDFDNAGLDLQSIADIANGPASPGVVTTRQNRQVKTVAKVIADLAGLDVGAAAAAQINRRIDDINAAKASLAGSLMTGTLSWSLAAAIPINAGRSSTAATNLPHIAFSRGDGTGKVAYFGTAKSTAGGNDVDLFTLFSDTASNTPLFGKGFGFDLTNGRLGVLRTNPRVTMDLASAADAIALPSGTTAQRPTVGTSGLVRWNSETVRLEYSQASLWKTVPSLEDLGKSSDVDNTSALKDFSTLKRGDGSGFGVSGSYKGDTANGVVAVGYRQTGTGSSGNMYFCFDRTGSYVNGFAYGRTSARASLDFGDATDGILVPVGTTDQRGPARAGKLRYNSDSSTFEGYANGQWGPIAGGGGGVAPDVTVEVGNTNRIAMSALLSSNMAFPTFNGASATGVADVVFIVTQDSVGGWTIAWPSGALFQGGLAFQPDPAPGAVSIIEGLRTDNGPWMLRLFGLGFKAAN